MYSGVLVVFGFRISLWSASAGPSYGLSKHLRALVKHIKKPRLMLFSTQTLDTLKFRTCTFYKRAPIPPRESHDYFPFRDICFEKTLTILSLQGKRVRGNVWGDLIWHESSKWDAPFSLHPKTTSIDRDKTHYKSTKFHSREALVTELRSVSII